jgi:5-methylcytosine-specific restriction endonuclease McrA
MTVRTPAARAGKARWHTRYCKKYPEKIAVQGKRYRKKNRAVELARQQRWRSLNKEKRAAQRVRTRKKLLKQMPRWRNQFFIDEIYSLARLRTKLTRLEWHVDHIVPLRSKIVSGLHVEYNLRVIPKQVNIAKSNRHWPDMPEVAGSAVT